MSDLAVELEFATQVAHAAGQLVLVHYNTALAVESKADRSPVTIADRGAEKLLRERIEREFPSDGILGEEFGARKGTSGRRWILDPVDGTQSFIRGVPLFGVMVGLERDGEAVVGVVHFPALDETVSAARGHGCRWLRSRRRSADPAVPARVSRVEKLADSMVSVTSPGGFDAIGQTAAYERLRAAAALDRAWSDCYGHILVATGRIDVMVDPTMNVWDCAALAPILTEAGGTFTDWNGVATIHGGNAISTNGKVLPEVLAALRAR